MNRICLPQFTTIPYGIFLQELILDTGPSDMPKWPVCSFPENKNLVVLWETTQWRFFGYLYTLECICSKKPFLALGLMMQHLPSTLFSVGQLPMPSVTGWPPADFIAIGLRFPLGSAPSDILLSFLLLFFIVSSQWLEKCDDYARVQLLSFFF